MAGHRRQFVFGGLGGQLGLLRLNRLELGLTGGAGGIIAALSVLGFLRPNMGGLL